VRGIDYCLRREKPRPARPRPRRASVAGSGTAAASIAAGPDVDPRLDPL